jgi:hypothetical protein
VKGIFIECVEEFFSMRLWYLAPFFFFAFSNQSSMAILTSSNAASSVSPNAEHPGRRKFIQDHAKEVMNLDV